MLYEISLYHFISDCLHLCLSLSCIPTSKSEGRVHWSHLSTVYCSSSQYFLNRWTFCNPTWYKGASPWARIPWKYFWLQSSSSRPQWSFKYSRNYCPVSSDLLTLFDWAWYSGVFLLTRVRSLDFYLQSPVHRVQLFCEGLAILLQVNLWALCYQSWYAGVSTTVGVAWEV